MNEHPQSLGKGTHFGLSFLAVILGVPLSFGVIMFIGFIFMLLFALIISAGFSGSNAGLTGPPARTYSYAYGSETSSNRLVSVPVYGPILSQSSSADPLQSIFGGGFTDGEQVKEHLRELADDNSVKGVILEIDSPGGLITASKAIADGVEYVRSRNKPIIAHVNGYGASGGYWAAASTDYIAAEQGSETGSIGVILGDLPYYKNIIAIGDVATTEPIKIQSFSAGIGKDVGNPFREITPDETAYLNKILNNEYESFVSYVAARRNIDANTIKSTIKALAYDNQEAKNLKLIDEVMSKEQAYEELAIRADVSNSYVVEKELRSTDFFSSLLGVMHSYTKPKVDASEARGRYCSSLSTKPLVLGVPFSSICQ